MKRFIGMILVLGSMVAAGTASADIGFHNMPLNDYIAKIPQYEAQKVGARSVSAYPSAAGILVAGTYTTEEFDNVTRMTMGHDQFKAMDLEMKDQYGYTPNEVTVYLKAGRLPRFNVVYGASTIPHVAKSLVDDAGFDRVWLELVVQQGYRLKDHAVYQEAGERRHAVIFVKDGKGFSFIHGLSQQDFANKHRDLTAQGWVLDSMNVGEAPNVVYSGIYLRPTTGATNVMWDMDSVNYQARYTQFANQGFRLKKVIGYANGTRFAAIWTK